MIRKDKHLNVIPVMRVVSALGFLCLACTAIAPARAAAPDGSPAAQPLPSALVASGGASGSAPSSSLLPALPATPAAAAPILPSAPGVTGGLPMGDALPSAPVAASRSPGMQLPLDQSTGSAAGPSSSNNPYAPVQKPADSADIRGQAFGAALTGLLPLHPDEIRKLLERFDETQQAVQTPIFPTPQPEITAQTISLDPGATPPEIKVAVGHVTTLSLLDITGEPWPIQDLTWAGNFEIMQPEAGSNVIRITPTTQFTEGNISMRLVKLKTPVIFTLRTHRDKVQYRFDARIPENGPNTKPPIIDNSAGIGGPQAEAGDAVQNAILDGSPPIGSTRLTVTGVDGRTSAYKTGGQTYVRTPLTLLSPAWSSSVTSADGTNVYTLADAPIVLLSDHGSAVQAHLTDHSDAVETFDEKTESPGGVGGLFVNRESSKDAAQ